MKVDGSAVYEFPNFDSPTLEYMDQGKKIKISKKIYPGIGGLGAFYKVRLKKGVYGFIADTDAEVSRRKLSEKEKSEDSDEDDQKLEEGTDPTKLQSEFYKEDENEGSDDSFYTTQFLGLSYASYNYYEKLRNRTVNSAVALFGVRKSGPMNLLGGFPMDINILFTSTAPDFYNKIATSTSGLMLIADALVMLPLYETKSLLLYYGFGAMIRYSSWKVKLRNFPNGAPLDSQELGVGAAAGVGLAYRLGRSFCLRADGKYYYENERYMGFGAALQFKY